MEVEYGLITSSAVPEKLRASDSFMEVDQEQWYDLVEYSKQLKPLKESEKVMVLVVAHGTPEEEEAERKRLELEEKELARIQAERDKLAEDEARRREEEEQNQRLANRLRARSKEIMNALYGR
tara:strand:- start:2388 stop:2756 length:369 start_codon:yes stop_codon:yes gene_type:complete